MEKTPNIFIDSNIFFNTYPFERNSFNESLLFLANSSHIKLYISNIVYGELIENYKKNLQLNIDSLIRSKKKIEKIINEDITTNQKPIEKYIEDYTSYLDSLIYKRIINKINYDKDLFDEIVHRSIKKIKPFSDNREEFRDCVTWLTYRDYIIKNNLKNCYFLTNDIKDFYNDNKDDLHTHLKQELPDLKIYKSTEELFLNVEYFSKVKAEEDLVAWSATHLDNKKLLDIIPKDLGFDIESICQSYINNTNPNEILNNNVRGEFEFVGITYFEIGNKSFVVVRDFCYITCTITMKVKTLLKQNVYNERDTLIKNDIFLTLKGILNFTIKPEEDAKFVTIKDLEILDKS